VWCVCIQSDVYAQLPYHEVVECSSKDLQLPSWVLEGQALRRRQQQVSTTPRGVTTQLPSGGRKVRTVNAKEAAQAAAARRQDCTYDASSASRRQSQQRRHRRRPVTATV